jgi:hypothetical protein
MVAWCRAEADVERVAGGRRWLRGVSQDGAQVLTGFPVDTVDADAPAEQQ